MTGLVGTDSNDRHATTKWRWRAAEFLNRSPSRCWAHLVTWALGWTPLNETAVDSNCRSDMERNGCCYCGKLKRSVDPS